MPTEDSHAQPVIADLQAKLRSLQADYASLHAALSHESTPWEATNKDAEIAKLKTQLENLERSTAISDSILKRLYAREAEKLKQDIVDSQSV